MKYFYLLILLSTLSSAEINSLPSFQGFTGVVNTPNAQVLNEGEIGLEYTNQVENTKPKYPKNYRKKLTENNYMLNMGILPGLEGTLRYSDGGTLGSDRIVNLKYKIPLINQKYGNYAFGLQDIGGGATHMRSAYIVASDTMGPVRGSLGYAYASDQGGIDGIFGSLEMQAMPWLQFGAEYDTHEFNGVVKAGFSTQLGKQDIKIGAMLKSALKHMDTIYTGIYISFPFNTKFKDIIKDNDTLPQNINQLRQYGFSNITYKKSNNTLWFSYENTLYDRNDLDALAIVLAVLSRSEIADKMIVTIRKSNIDRYSIMVDSTQYRNFLDTGVYTHDLLTFSPTPIAITERLDSSDRFKPIIKFQPAFILVDGSEYGNMDYTLAFQTELSMRLAQGTIFVGRLNIPISMSNNFAKNGIFDYRNRNKTDLGMDQILLSQFYQTYVSSMSWMNLLQIGLFDKDLTGISYESAIQNTDGKHLLMLKLAYLKDNIYTQIDRYSNTDKRFLKLISYRYYWNTINSDIKVTAGEFLYGDRGIDLSLKRYFNDVTLQIDLSHTSHPLRGNNTVGKLSISVPLSPKKRFNTQLLDVAIGDLNYERRKTVVSSGKTSFAQPLHLKEIQNSYTIENYYLNKGRLQPSYIKKNHYRLRGAYLND